MSLASITGDGSAVGADLLVREVAAPGASVGTLFIDGDLSLGDGAVYEWDYDSTGKDLIDITGNLKGLGDWTLKIQTDQPMAIDQHVLFKYDGIFTLPTLIGKRNGLRLYTTIVVLCYLTFLWMSLSNLLPIWSLIVMLSLPLPYHVLRDMFRKIPENADARTAQMFNACGVLLIASLILEKLV